MSRQRESRAPRTAKRRGLGFWVRRYLPNEIAGTVAALSGAAIAYEVSGSLLVAAIAGTIAENVGFYGVAVTRTLATELRTTARGRRWALARTAVLTAVEFGPAEFLDFFAVRPALLYFAPIAANQPLVGWLFGKLAADVVFYAVAAFSYSISHPRAQRDRSIATAVRSDRIETLRELDRRVDIDALVAEHGTPLLLLDPSRLASDYERLRRALPFVRFHYAVKALSHPAALQALHEIDGCFDVASDGELDALERLGVPASRIIYTQPVKTPAEITRAYVHGVRTFVIDSEDELRKFGHVPADARLLIRLAFRNRSAKSDLSSKFGVSAAEAERLIELAATLGVSVVGLSFHVGSQLTQVEPWRRAVVESLALIDRLASRGIRLDVLDIGGGFPVAHRTEVPSFERIASVLRPLLEPRAETLTILAEPGRVVAANSATLVTQVTGIRERDGLPWIWIDEGVYGSYSNVTTEDVHPVVIARSELTLERELFPTTIAGPTCDSVDIVARDYPLPSLVDGDLILSPAMGAYTAVTSTSFNGRARAAVIVVREPSSAPVAVLPVVPAPRRARDVAIA